MNQKQINDMKQQIRKEILDLDNQIYDLQTLYLQSTKQTGNLIKGFDNYLGAKTARNQLTYKKQKIQNYQRIFSLSSVTCRTNQNFENSFMAQPKNQSSHLNPPKRNRNRLNSKKGKANILEQDHDSVSVSPSQSNVYSDSQSRNKNKNRVNKNRKAKIIKKM